MLPMLDGVLDLSSYQLLPHSPSYLLTWCVPYRYNPLATCQPVQDWLEEMCNGDRSQIELLRAYLYGIITGRTDWQRFLELIGPGGSGKSTYMRLAMALVGDENAHVTTLKKLETNRFESANIFGKRLVVVTDAERYAGEVSLLKALTGQDKLPFEKKFKQGTTGFYPNALVILAANETVQHGDYTSGCGRRRMPVPMSQKIHPRKQRNLIEFKQGKWVGEFVPYLPGLLNWVLSLNGEQATYLVKNYEDSSQRLASTKAQVLVEANPIADWLDHNLVYRPFERVQVGVAKRDKRSDSQNMFLRTGEWLYANFAEYCHSVGHKIISLRRFINLLSDLCLNQLGLKVNKGRDREGSYFLGLKIRTSQDDDPLLITGNSLVESSGNNNCHPSSCGNNTISNYAYVSSEQQTGRKNHTLADVTANVTASVTVQSLTGDGCDGCDGLIQLNKGKKEKKVVVEKNQEKFFLETEEKLPVFPSHPSQQQPQNHVSQEV